MRGIVAALALSVGLVAVTAASAGGRPSLFPLGAGTSWTLSDERGNELTIRSNRSGSSYVLRGLPGLASVRVRANRRNIEAWDSRSSSWKSFLRLAAPAGTRYRVDFPEAPLWRAVEVTVESRSAVCADARDRPVRSCVALALRTRKPIADAGVERLVFAPGIGLAEVVVQTIAGPRTYTLGGGGAPLE